MTPPTDTEHHAKHARIVDEHRALREALDRIEVIAAADPNVLPEPRVRALIEREVTTLRTLVHGHLAFEEEGGYLTGVLERRPGLTHEVERLAKQHDQIRSLLGDLAGAVARSAPIADLHDAIKRTVALIRDHEHGETSVLQRSVLEDIGAAD